MQTAKPYNGVQHEPGKYPSLLTITALMETAIFRGILSMRSILILALTVTLAACASDPLLEARLGDPRPLANMVISGEVKPNVRIKGSGKTSFLPLCSLIEHGHKDARQAVDQLLRMGSDLNMACSDSPDTSYPLDTLMSALAVSVALPDPYWGGRPRPPAIHRPYQQELADRFIDQGALLGGKKRVSKSEFRQLVDEKTQEHNQHMLWKQESYNKQIASNQAFVSGVASVGQVALGAYVAKEAAKTSASSIPLAQLPGVNGGTSANPMDSGSTRNGTTSSPTQRVRPEVQAGTRPAAAAPVTPPAPERLLESKSAAVASPKREPDIREPEWDFGGRVWMEGPRPTRAPVATRALACQQAKSELEDYIAVLERSSSHRGIERRSDCVCSYDGWGKAWFCRVYYLPVGHSARTPGMR